MPSFGRKINNDFAKFGRGVSRDFGRFGNKIQSNWDTGLRQTVNTASQVGNALEKSAKIVNATGVPIVGDVLNVGSNLSKAVGSGSNSIRQASNGNYAGAVDSGLNSVQSLVNAGTGAIKTGASVLPLVL